MNRKIEKKLVELAEKHENSLNTQMFDASYKMIYDDCVEELKVLYNDKNLSIVDLSIIKKNTNGFSRGHRAFTLNPRIIKDATHKIDFNSLYPNIMLKLNDLNIISFNDYQFSALYKDLFENRAYIKKKYYKKNIKVYTLLKIIINYTYGVLGSTKSYYSITNFGYISQYVHNIFQMLVDMTNSVISINVDEIYLKNYEENKILIHHILDKLELPYEVETL